MRPKLRNRLEDLIAKIEKCSGCATEADHQANLNWLAANFRFTLLLDEVGRRIEPAYRLKERWLLGEIDQKMFASQISGARKAFEAAPIEELF